MSASEFPTHGGPDVEGIPICDLSTNANPCGPCPHALAALGAIDRTRYPDPAYTALRAALAQRHAVAPARIVVGSSASALILRLTGAVAHAVAADGRQRARVRMPRHAYGDYARAAAAFTLESTPDAASADLVWACEPSSPMGQNQPDLARQANHLRAGQVLVLDQAYEPLRLRGAVSLSASQRDRVWRLITPNKALGLTGVRGAYAIAPATTRESLLRRVHALAPSWPLGADGVALLACWASDAAVHDWLANSREHLRTWRARQVRQLESLGWQVNASDTPFFTATHPAWSASGSAAARLHALLAALRTRGFKLRDCASFGMPGTVRMAVTTPTWQDRFCAAWSAILDQGEA